MKLTLLLETEMHGVGVYFEDELLAEFQSGSNELLKVLTKIKESLPDLEIEQTYIETYHLGDLGDSFPAKLSDLPRLLAEIDPEEFGVDEEE